MAQTESIERFSQIQAARAVSRVASDSTYHPVPEMFEATSGTGIAVEPTEREFAEPRYYWMVTGRQDDVLDKTVSAMALTIYHDNINYVSTEVAIDLRSGDDSSYKFLINPIFHEVSALPASDFTPVFQFGHATQPIGQTARSADDLSTVVDYARKHGLKGVADRLVEIGEQPLDNDELALPAGPAMNFTKYCIARKKQSPPLMTVTPTGELDATWKSRGGHRVVMRFFPDGSVWVAYKLWKVKGSFQVDAVYDLLDLDMPIKIPDWA